MQEGQEAAPDGPAHGGASSVYPAAWRSMGMKLRYLFVDRNGQLTVIRRADVEALWQGELGADVLNGPDLHELRLASVLCNSRLVPQKIFLLRLPLTAGYFTRSNYRTLR